MSIATSPVNNQVEKEVKPFCDWNTNVSWVFSSQTKTVENLTYKNDDSTLAKVAKVFIAIVDFVLALPSIVFMSVVSLLTSFCNTNSEKEANAPNSIVSNVAAKVADAANPGANSKADPKTNEGAKK